MKKNFYIVLNILIIAGIIYTGIDCFYLFMEAKIEQTDLNVRVTETEQKAATAPSNQKLNDYRVIQNRNIFGESPQKTGTAKEIPEIENLEQTTLKITLVGTIYGDRKDAAAIIQDKIKRSQDLYRVGDSIQDAIIKNIFRGKVVLSYKGRNEILVMDEPKSGDNTVAPAGLTPPSPNRTAASSKRTITVRRDDILKSLEDPDNIRSQANIRPHLTDGRTDGISIAGIKTGSVFRKMGFMNGDILKRIEGNEITSPEDIVSLYNKLKSEDSVSVGIIRRGREYTYSYRFR